ncbi:MAG: glycine--tRNA ligase, partial [Chthoniobacteraceae bacterium]
MSQPKETPLMEKIVSLCKRRGFIFQSSEIYGGINGFWDYGPLGAELKRNLRDTWWRAMTRDREDVVGLDATIIMHPKIWEASGHVTTFADMMRECSMSNKRVRADHVPPQSGTVYSWEGARDEQPEEDHIKALQRGTEFTNILNDLEVPPTEFWDRMRKARRDRGDWIGALEVVSETFDRLNLDEERRSILEDMLSPECKISAAVLVPPGKPVESAKKIAVDFYKTKGLVNPTLAPPTSYPVKDSVDFHPETGGKLRNPVPFNLMLKTYVGPTATEKDVAYLRPETAQAIFAQFKNVVDSSRQKVPFGICQIGKAFRNEVTPRNFTFRSREFEQMELEFFIAPDEAIRILHGSVAQWGESADLSAPQPNWGWEMWHHYWEKQRVEYYNGIGLGTDLLDYHRQKPDELAHYARACVDILFKFPFGTEELEGIAARSDFDLSQHQKHSGKSQEIFDEELRDAAGKLDAPAKAAFVASVSDERAARAAKNGKPEDAARTAAAEFCEKLFKGQYVPHVIEPSAGLDRLALAVLAAAYHEEEKADVNGKIEKRIVLRFHPRIAPVKVGVFPLLKNKPELVAK